MAMITKTIKFFLFIIIITLLLVMVASFLNIRKASAWTSSKDGFYGSYNCTSTAVTSLDVDPTRRGIRSPEPENTIPEWGSQGWTDWTMAFQSYYNNFINSMNTTGTYHLPNPSGNWDEQSLIIYYVGQSSSTNDYFDFDFKVYGDYSNNGKWSIADAGTGNSDLRTKWRGNFVIRYYPHNGVIGYPGGSVGTVSTAYRYSSSPSNRVYGTSGTENYGVLHRRAFPATLSKTGYDCIKHFNNVDIEGDYTGDIPPGISIAEPEVPPAYAENSCGKLDVGCWFSTFVDGAVTELQREAQLIVDFFKYMFIPREGIINGYYTEVNDLLRTKMGVLTMPFDFFVDLKDALTSKTPGDTIFGVWNPNKTTFSIAGIAVPIGINVTSISYFTDPIKPLLQAIAIITIVYILVSSYNRIVSGGTEE